MAIPRFIRPRRGMQETDQNSVLPFRTPVDSYSRGALGRPSGVARPQPIGP
ncbi:hypothetical protein PHAMO_40087 [Magnetospirillum molischianum DSM 120]|uniref:Uncharacterized protein n=1 Tax=Magnetospirillum molischianum DSM 120 TaxID=1150626 RepID=H8FVY8_MAGML|nr:hypothetical protein PHAMO_40087 [Magnetospirillum molischianum DSM 120]